MTNKTPIAEGSLKPLISAEYEAASKTLREYIAMLPEDRRVKAEKAMALSDAIVNGMQNIADDIRKAYPPKRIFRKVDRRPKKRMQKVAAKLKPVLTAHFVAQDLQFMMATPAPNYAPGGVVAAVDFAHENEPIIIKTRTND